MAERFSLTFCGGAGGVTGANFLLERETPPFSVLVDCGLVQGRKFADEENHAPFPYDAGAVDALFVTHAHIDHIGRIPRLVRAGFRGRIVSTPETRRLAELLLADALRLIALEKRKGERDPLYSAADLAKTFTLWEALPYHAPFPLGGFTVIAKDAGHILGSAMYEMAAPHGGKIVFTGDLGNSPSPILRDTEPIVDASYLVMESVYGDRDHEPPAVRREKLADAIGRAVARGGALLIPSFSVEKTQVILHEIDALLGEGKIPSVPVFLDSPLAIAVTEVYRLMRENWNDAAKVKHAGSDIFSFPKLTVTRGRADPRRIHAVKGPKIIIAGSGMSTGGRIIEHEREYLTDPSSTILFVGFQAAGSLGREIQDGARSVRIGNENVPVKAATATINGYSSHKDREHLIAFASATAPTLRRVFVAMGEPRAGMFLAQRLRDYLGIDAVYPEKGERFSVEL